MFNVPETCRACSWYKPPDPIPFGTPQGDCECPEADPRTKKISDAIAMNGRPLTCPYNTRKEIFHGRDKFGYY